MIIIKNASIILTVSIILSLVVNKAKMLSAGVTSSLKFLKSEMLSSVQTLGNIRMLIDAQGKRNSF